MTIFTIRVLLILASMLMILLSTAFIVFYPSEYSSIFIANIAMNVVLIYLNADAIERER